MYNTTYNASMEMIIFSDMEGWVGSEVKGAGH